jgi:hypothetical protein
MGARVLINGSWYKGDPRPGPDAKKWCVGIAVDVEGGKFYWSQIGESKSGAGQM